MTGLDSNYLVGGENCITGRTLGSRCWSDDGTHSVGFLDIFGRSLRTAKLPVFDEHFIPSLDMTKLSI